MDNYEIAKHFSLLSKLMEIHGENSFKSKTYSIAAYKIEQLTVQLQTLSSGKIFSINGIGEAIGRKILELIEKGTMKSLDELLSKTPAGIIEIMKIKGIGPKKISIIWKEMNVENIGELLYACHENRLSLLKGFGKKTQDNVIESIEFFLKQKGNYLYAQAEQLAFDIEQLLWKIFASHKIKITGSFARQNETVDELEFVIPFPEKIISEKIKAFPEFYFLENTDEYFLYKYNDGIKVKLYSADEKNLMIKIFDTTNSSGFNESFYKEFIRKDIENGGSDEEIFIKAGLQYISPALRESENIIKLAKEKKVPALIQPEDILGIIHCHSNWSDGSNTL
jgi:DNA polymerase (family X)